MAEKAQKRNRNTTSKKKKIERILKSGQKVFFAKSYAKATMDEIAAMAEISKPTLYQYFKTKDDLYFSLMLPVIDDISHNLERVEKKTLAGCGSKERLPATSRKRILHGGCLLMKSASSGR